MKILNFVANVSINVPSTNFDAAISADEYAERVNAVMGFFAQKFGGATAQAAGGAYVADNGQLIVENVTIVSAYVDGDNDRLPYLESFMEDTASIFCESWHQECVLYTVNGIAYLANGGME